MVALEETVPEPEFKIKFPAPPVAIVRSPAVVPHDEVAPAVSVSAPLEVNDEAPVGVRLTLPAPLAVKFPAARARARS